MNGIQITLGVKIICSIITIIFTGWGIYYGWVKTKIEGNFISNCIPCGTMAILLGVLMFVGSIVVDCLIIGFFAK